MDNEEIKTPIQNFYAGQSVLITGSTGFLGKIVVEKLLRSCPDISTIYLLIRVKKNKSPESRMEEMFDNVLYDRLKKEVPNFRKKVMLIVGDLDSQNLGLSENDKNILIHKVSIIFHIAANVRFQHEMKFHIKTNVYGVNYILSIAKLVQNLKSFIYVSTAYSNFNMKDVKEHVYTYPINYKDLITYVSSENAMEEKIMKIASQWPNTYSFTKAMAEGLVRDNGGNLPIGIFRPAIITSTASEPIVGWNDNYFSEIGFVVATVTGYQRLALCNPKNPLHFVPVDFTANALIASAWDVCNQFKKNKDMLVYNFVSPTNGPSVGEWVDKMIDINETYPSHKAQWLPFVILFQQKTLYRFCTWFVHLFPALFADLICICMNRRPRMWKIQKRIDKMSYELAPFMTNRWNFFYDNVETMWNRLNEQDQQLFKFEMKKLDWMKYFIDHHKGVRFYILKEDDSTLEISRIKHRRLYWIHQIFKILFIFIIFWVIWIVYAKFCLPFCEFFLDLV